MAPIAFLAKSRPCFRLKNFKSISTFVHLHQEAQLAESHAEPPPLPANPTSGNPRYHENWRNPIPASSSGALIPVGVGFQQHVSPLPPLLDAESLTNQFASWTTTQQWKDIKELFDYWVSSLDKNGKPNKPDVNLYNQYIRANLMDGATAGELLDIVEKMEDYKIVPNTASYNLVLKAIQRDDETLAVDELIERMLEKAKEHKESLPDNESYDLVIETLLSKNQMDLVLKYIDLTLKSGYMLSVKAFENCVLRCLGNARLDTLVSIIERCKKMDQSKFLCLPWNLCNRMADVAMQSDNSELTYYALEFIAKLIAGGENVRPPVQFSINEGLAISALCTAGKTYNSRLLEGSWSVLKRSLRQNKVPSPESYLAKIYGHANLGDLPKAFRTLHEFETAYGNSSHENGEDLFSPFHSLNPLVAACSRNGFTTLDTVYYQLENLSRDKPPYKSVAALNCVILGCANIWDVDRAYQTFNAINATFGLTPDVHSYNALICAFGKNSKTDEAVKVYEHFVGLGLKPNATTYSLLVDAHLIKRDPEAALTVIDEMISAGHEPSRDMLKKVRRRCVREMDNESDRKVDALAKEFKIRMGRETRRDTLFNLQYSADN